MYLGKWLGSVRQQAITWANIDSYLCHQMISLGHNELRHKQVKVNIVDADLLPSQKG